MKYLESSEQLRVPENLRSLYKLANSHGPDQVLFWLRQQDYPDLNIWDPLFWEYMSAERIRYEAFRPTILVSEEGNYALAAECINSFGQVEGYYPLLALTHPNGSVVPQDISRSACNLWGLYHIFNRNELDFASNIIYEFQSRSFFEKPRSIVDVITTHWKRLIFLGLILFAGNFALDKSNQSSSKINLTNIAISLLNKLPAQAQAVDTGVSTPLEADQNPTNITTETDVEISPFPLRISHYDPALGGTNCDSNCSVMASGDTTWDWQGGKNGIYAAACPSEWPFGTRFKVYDITYECRDRGGWIKCLRPGERDKAITNAHNAVSPHLLDQPAIAEVGYCWVDLYNTPPVPYGTMFYDWNFVK